MKTLDELGTSPAPWWAKNVHVINVRGCVVASVPIIGNPQKTADAHLVAAAPALYEALRMLLNTLDGLGFQPILEGDQLAVAVKCGQRAIADASGESEVTK